MHYCQTSGTFRFFAPGKSFENGDQYEGILSVMWLGERIAFAYGAKGINGAKHLKSVTETLTKAGAWYILTIRHDGRRMPRPWSVLLSLGDEALWKLKTE
jgi:hypothetical protein